MRRARSSNRELDDRRHFVCLDFKNMASHGAAIRGYTLHPVQLHTASFIQGDRPEWVGRLKVLLGFRFSAKSWKLRQWVKFRWLRCPWMQFILHSSNDQMAKRFVRAIKDELAYDPLTAHLIPEPSASDFEFNLRGIRPEQGTSLVAAGIRTSMTGSRADGYLFDDPEPEVDPEAMYDRLISAFSEAGSILHAPDRHLSKFVDEIGRHPTEVPVPEQTQMIVVGQPHCATTAYLPREDDIDIHGEGHPLRSAKFLIIPAVQRNGDWTWPEQMNRKYYNFAHRRPMTVAEVKNTMTTSRWELQYQINTDYAQKAGPVLRVREILLHTHPVLDPIMIVDPADSEDGCMWGIAIGGMFRSKAHVLYLGGMQGEAYFDFDIPAGASIWRDVFDLATEFGVVRVYLEKNLKAAAVSCRRYIQSAGITVTVEEYAAKMNKLRRICEALEQPVNNGVVTAHPRVLADEENLRELTKLRWDRLPKPNDPLDALAELVNRLLEDPAAAMPYGVQQPTSPPPTGGSFSRVVTTASSFERLQR